MSRHPEYESKIQDGIRRLTSALDRVAFIQKTLGQETPGQKPPGQALGANSPVESAPASPLREALAFSWSQAAWAAIELAQAWVLSERLGFAKKETENFDLLVRAGHIELDVGRRLKQACEFRLLASRDEEKIDWAYFAQSDTSELTVLRDWANEWRNRWT